MSFIFNLFKNLFKKKNTESVIVEPTVVITKEKEKDRDKFETAMKFIRVVEGGKFFHPNDPGGFTNMGLTRRDYPNLDLENLTRKQADDIFYKDYWKRSAATYLPFPAYISYFDSVVNTGINRANKILQKSLGVEVDGLVGKITLKALEKVSPIKLALDIANNKQNFYANLTKKNSRYKPFLKGWTRRTNALVDYIKKGDFSW